MGSRTFRHKNEILEELWSAQIHHRYPSFWITAYDSMIFNVSMSMILWTTVHYSTMIYHALYFFCPKQGRQTGLLLQVRCCAEIQSDASTSGRPSMGEATCKSLTGLKEHYVQFVAGRYKPHISIGSKCKFVSKALIHSNDMERWALLLSIGTATLPALQEAEEVTAGPFRSLQLLRINWTNMSWKSAYFTESCQKNLAKDYLNLSHSDHSVLLPNFEVFKRLKLDSRSSNDEAPWLLAIGQIVQCVQLCKTLTTKRACRLQSLACATGGNSEVSIKS